MLAHSQRYLDAYSEWGADLVLSGHNHGGLARIHGVCGVISTEARLFPKYTKGFYYKGDTTMLVSAGIGGHTLPIRFFNLPEALIITLKKED
jgi:predicted MPP superfamily phosphohydrolase